MSEETHLPDGMARLLAAAQGATPEQLGATPEIAERRMAERGAVPSAGAGKTVPPKDLQTRTVVVAITVPAHWTTFSEDQIEFLLGRQPQLITFLAREVVRSLQAPNLSAEELGARLIEAGRKPHAG